MKNTSKQPTPLKTTCRSSSVHQVAVKYVTAVDKVFKLTENPGKPKITEFDDMVFGDEDVFRLDVSVNALQEQT